MTHVADIAWPEASDRAASGDVVVIPIGATEQHGLHLPLTTDTDVAEAVVARAALLEPRIVVAPAVPYGSSGEHQDFPGTLSIGQEATELLLVEIGRSATIAFSHVVLACTHGGNAGPLGRALGRLATEGRSVHGWWPRWGGDLHAGVTETSLLLALDPARVDLAKAVPGDLRTAAELLPELTEHGVRAISASGVLGDPTGATAESGMALLDEAAADLASTVASLSRAHEKVGLPVPGPSSSPASYSSSHTGWGR